MKSRVSVIKMDQFLIKEENSFELEDLHVILIKNVEKDKERAKIEAEKQYELYKYLNPRYLEHGITPKEALIKLDAKNPRFNFNQGLIRTF
jgi:hypothetical protein